MTHFKLGVLALVSALLLGVAAFGLGKTADVQAHPVSVTVSGSPAIIGGNLTVTFTFVDDEGTTHGDTNAVISASGLGSFTAASSANSDGTVSGVGTLSVSLTPDTDTVSEAITFVGTFQCFAAGTVTFTATEGTASATPIAGMTATGTCATSLTPTATTAPATITADSVTVTANPTTIEVFPVGTSQVASLITVRVKDSAGAEVVGQEVIALAPSGFIDATDPTNTSVPDTDTDGDGFIDECEAGTDTSPLQDEQNTVASATGTLGGTARFVFCARAQSAGGSTLTATLGPNKITIIVHQDEAAINDIIKTVDITVVGPPATITLSASPTSLVCGEKSTITGTVKDAIGQVVSTGTPLNLVTNFGGVLAPGASGFGGVSAGLTDSSGTTTGFLLTSTTHVGPYEVVASADSNGDGVPDIFAQVTVTCTAGAVPTTAPSITAPTTGQGITPPSTGDAGLASSSSSWTLFTIGGMAAFALASLATLRFARR